MTKKVIKVGNISKKEDILRFEDKSISVIGDKTKRSLGMTPDQRQLEESRLKASNMQIKK